MLKIKLTNDQCYQSRILLESYGMGGKSLFVNHMNDPFLPLAISLIVQHGIDIVETYDPHILRDEQVYLEDKLKMVRRLNSLLGL